MVNCSPQRQQSIYEASQSNSLAPIVSDTLTTTSPVTMLSIVECLTTGNNVNTERQDVSSMITTSAGLSIYVTKMYFINQPQLYNRTTQWPILWFLMMTYKL